MGSKLVSVGEVAAINSGQYSKSECWDRIQYLDTGSITRGMISSLQQLDPRLDKVPSRARRKVRDKSILLSMVRPNQEHYGILDNPPKDMLASTGFSVIDADEKLVDPSYLYYALTTKEATAKLQALAEQSASTYPTLSGADLASFEIPLLAFDLQRKIGGILSCFDRKIDINSRLNGYLDELCNAIYQDFVNRHIGSWRKGTLKELLDIKYGKDHKKLADGPYPVYGSGGYMRSVEKSLANGESVLIPRKGTLNNVMYVDEEFWTVDTMFYTVPRMPGAAKYAFQYIRKLDLASMNSGSAVPSMTTAILNALELPIPSSEALRELDEQLRPMYKFRATNREEIEQLSALRDALLPKLMSGEIDFSGVDFAHVNSHLLDC